MHHKGDGDANCNWYTWNSLKRFWKKLDELEIRERFKTIQITALLKSARILRRVLEKLLGENRKECNMKATVILIVTGTHSTVTKELVQEIEDLEIRGRVKTTQTTALLRSTRILRTVLETCCHLDSSGKSYVNAVVKKSQMSKIIIDNYLDLARELKNQWNMKLTVIAIVVGELLERSPK